MGCVVHSERVLATPTGAQSDPRYAGSGLLQAPANRSPVQTEDIHIPMPAKASNLAIRAHSRGFLSDLRQHLIAHRCDSVRLGLTLPMRVTSSVFPSRDQIAEPRDPLARAQCVQLSRSDHHQ